MSDHTNLSIESQALHAGHTLDGDHRSRAVPIYQTTSYVFEDTNHAAGLFDLKVFGHIYSRISNPTVEVLENRVAALEGGAAGLAVSSGQAASTFSVLNIAGAGDHIVAGSQLYGGTYNLFKNSLKHVGIDTTFVDIQNLDAVKAAIKEHSKLIYTEVIGNPALNMPDLEALATIAHDAGVPLIVDATVPTAALLRSIDYGADIVVASCTKWLGGHGTSIGGIIIDSGKFDWTSSDKFPGITKANPNYHGRIFSEEFGNLAYIVKARTELLRDFGSALSPFNAFLILQGVETLPLRMERHSQNALALAEHLQGHEKVEWVNYPGLESSHTHELAKKYLKKGFGSLLTFGVKGGLEAGRKFIESVKLASFLANIGDARTLVIHPASTTHSQLNPEELKSTGVTEELVRVSVGLEHIDDIKADFDQALNAV